MNSINLYVDKIGKYFEQPTGRLTLFNNLTIQFSSDKTYAIMGTSGSGKSTLMHLLAGIEIPDHGTIYCDDTDLFGMSDKNRRLFLNKTIGLVLQHPYLIGELSILENVIVPGLIAENELAWCLERGRMLLQAVGIAEKSENKPAQLSGGQQQRASIARALFNKPAFLLADEPTGSLDEDTSNAIIDLLKECHDEFKMGLIISTHDTIVAQRMDVTYVLSHGVIKPHLV